MIGLLISFAPNANAGKVEDVQKQVKADCGKDVDGTEALRLVKDLFMSCTPGGKTAIDGCPAVTCLKANSGAEVGK